MTDAQTPTYATDRRIGKAVAAEIAYAGVSRQLVADAIDLDKGSLSRSIAGKRQWKASEILGIAEYLDIPVSDLLEPRRPEPNGGPNTGGTQGVIASRCIRDPREAAYGQVLALVAA